MMYPCFWFDNKASSVAAFYLQLFPDARILQQSSMVILMEIRGTRIMLLNGGPKYKITPALSLFLYCGGEEEIDRIYHVLAEKGEVIMPLDCYPWASKYAWVTDLYGVSWQLDIDPINSPQKIVPNLLMVNSKKFKVKEAIEYYQSVFPNSRILLESPYPSDTVSTENHLLFAQFKINSFILNCMSSPEPQDYDFTHATSMVVLCQDQAEIDHYWDKLGAQGELSMCGWLRDKFGLSWQILPQNLGNLLSDPSTGPKVMKALGSMQKIEIEKLYKA